MLLVFLQWMVAGTWTRFRLLISMESDSDSDGSHISATPPRDPLPPQPSPQSPPKSKHSLLLPFSYKPRPKRHNSTILKTTKPKSKPKPTPNTKPKPEPANHETLSSTPLTSSTFPTSPFPLPPFTNRPTTRSDEFTEPIVPGSLGKRVFFSNSVKTDLNFESTEVIPEPDVNSVGQGSAVQKHSLNLIKCDAVSSILPGKKRNSVCEGNFVKLNINGYGHGRKFANRGFKRKSSNGNYMARGRRYFHKSKFRKRGGNDEDAEGEFVEDTVVLEANEGIRVREVDEAIEEAILACRTGATDENLRELLKLGFGYDSFRNGQLEAIKMVLQGNSTMLVLPTGAGKSLCYQLPAMVLEGVTLVVSPLMALMIDQLKKLPPMIQGGLLSSGQTAEEASETLRMLQEGALDVLFVSPERFLNAEFISILSAAPLISLVVVDEAHCVSEWSHNFRPSYMRLKASLLRTKLNVGCILAMTATATTRTLHAVMSALEVPQSNLIEASLLRENLQLSVSLSSNRMKDLTMLLNSSPFKDVQSIIIYCKFQYETDLISKYLCDNNILSKSYHSGIPAKDRNRTQELFCSNKVRVVVATVAFGMGLDKCDIGAVIHYSLPESLEEYVQEIGRAGRDGRMSYCHLLFDDTTYFKLRSFMYSDGIDEYVVDRFLTHIFNDGLEDSIGKTSSIVKETASRKFDMKDEVMLTILTHLELGEVQYLRMLPQINTTCTLNFHQTAPVLLARKDMSVAAILKKSETKQGQYVFDIPTVANSLEVTPLDLSDHLSSLKSKGEITYEMKDPAYCYTIVNVPEDLCSLASQLTKWLSEVESCKVSKLDAMYNAATYAVKDCDRMHGCQAAQHTSCLQRRIMDYFGRYDHEHKSDVPNRMEKSSRFLRADIKVFLQSNAQVKFTPRAVARIMHGIGSPAYPSATWSKTHFWGRYTQVDFRAIMEAAKEELLNLVGKNVV